jgi:Domain of unknown function (DUF4388)
MKHTDYAVIEGVELITYLQMVEVEKKDYLLAVTAREKNGSIFMRDGELADARTATHDAEKAVLEMMAWSDVQITAIPWKGHRQHKKLTRSLASLIFESAQQEDESCDQYHKELEGQDREMVPGLSHETSRNNDSFAYVENMISSIKDLRFYLIMNNKGELLCQSRGSGTIGADFISYVHYNGTISKNDKSLPCNFSYFQFSLENDCHIIIFCDEHTVVGIETQAYFDCSELVTQMKPILPFLPRNRSISS